jgi:L-alanine-DL-glutamate epimerase-like enolase superfamily enzyme
VSKSILQAPETHPFRLQINWQERSFLLAKPFKISRGTKTHAQVIELSISLQSNIDANANEHVGWSEAVPYARYDESIESTCAQLNAIVPKILALSALNPRTLIQNIQQFIHVNLPPCSARNLLDCALWDIKAKLYQQSVNQLTSLPFAHKKVSAQTLSVDSIDVMLAHSKQMSHLPLLKVKLDEHDVIDKMRAIHQACPNSQLIIDANEAWSFDLLQTLLPKLDNLNIVLIEQPLRADHDNELVGFTPSIPLCADESCHTAENIDELKQKYQMVNIKLDKTGGLSEAISLYRAAKQADMQIMLGCMVASSLAMAPIFTLAHGADYIDLDGPVLVAQDRPNGFVFNGSEMSVPDKFLWGNA